VRARRSSVPDSLRADGGVVPRFVKADDLIQQYLIVPLASGAGGSSARSRARLDTESFRTVMLFPANGNHPSSG
jgi:hypothetical protein